jgi:hypothetical protein
MGGASFRDIQNSLWRRVLVLLDSVPHRVQSVSQWFLCDLVSFDGGRLWVGGVSLVLLLRAPLLAKTPALRRCNVGFSTGVWFGQGNCLDRLHSGG